MRPEDSISAADYKIHGALLPPGQTAAVLSTHRTRFEMLNFPRKSSSIFNKQFAILAVYLIIFVYLLSLLFTPSNDRSNFFEKNYKCVNEKTELLEYDECTIRDKLNVKGFTNTDETKYHIMPTESAKSSDCTVISLGVGKDVEAEKQMLTALPQCEFFGADPVNDTNADIYPEVGKFYNVAVGGSNGTMQANVLEDHYQFKDVKYIDLATFMRNYVKKPIIDQMWIDIEHAEYPMLPYLLKTGQLAKENVTICQINIEVHNPSAAQKQEFYKFFKLMMAEKQFTMLTASTIIGHIRLFMLNYAAEECHQRFVGDIYDR